VAGYPGRQVVLARRAGNAWYVAGINADDEDVALDLDLSFAGGHAGVLITDGAGEREFTQGQLRGAQHQRITIKAHGGFAARFQ
jgi:hypothetical protein